MDNEKKHQKNHHIGLNKHVCSLIFSACECSADDAGAGPSDMPHCTTSQDVFLCPPEEDTGFAQSVDPEDTIESLKKTKIKLQIKLLDVQNEYYTLKLKRLKNAQWLYLCLRK